MKHIINIILDLNPLIIGRNINIYFFESYGLGIVYEPDIATWSIDILFISIIIRTDKNREII